MKTNFLRHTTLTERRIVRTNHASEGSIKSPSFDSSLIKQQPSNMPSLVACLTIMNYDFANIY